MTEPNRAFTDEEARMRNLVLTFIPDAERLCRTALPARGTRDPFEVALWQHEVFAQLDQTRAPQHPAHNAPFDIRMLRAALLADQAVLAFRRIRGLIALFPAPEEAAR